MQRGHEKITYGNGGGDMKKVVKIIIVIAVLGGLVGLTYL